jgi:hypothetical protein
VTLTTPTLDGSHRIGFTARMYSDRSVPVEARVYDVTNSVEYAFSRFHLSSQNDGDMYSGFFYLSFSSQARQLELQWKGADVGGPSGTYYIAEAWLEVWKEPS